VTTRKRVSLVVALGALLLGGLAIAWSCNHWELEKMAQIGEAAGPIVGVLSLAAIVAALWSVRIQRYALELQRRAMIDEQESVTTQLALQREELGHQREALDIQRRAATDQQDSLKAQLDLQRQELAHQRESLEAELSYRRHTALREVYVPFITASDAYMAALHEYHKNMIRTEGTADRRARQEWRRPCDEAYAELK
jgi:DNA-binding helix-hairpin-helix protein with protein kinase domain